MELKIVKNAGSHRISVHGEATIYHLAEIRETLNRELPVADRLEVDLSEITELDSAFCQILISAWLQGRRDGKPVEIVGQNEISRGFVTHLHLPFLNKGQQGL